MRVGLTLWDARACLFYVTVGARSSRRQNHPTPFEQLQQAPVEEALHACMHPNASSCTVGAGQFFLNEMPNALRLYVPLNIIMALLYRRSQLVNKCGRVLPTPGAIALSRPVRRLTIFLASRRPGPVVARFARPGTFLYKTAFSSVRSAVFLSTYCTVSLLMPCYFRTLLGTDYPFAYGPELLAAPRRARSATAHSLAAADARATRGRWTVAGALSRPRTGTMSTGSWAACRCCSRPSRAGLSWPCTVRRVRSSRSGTA